MYVQYCVVAVNYLPVTRLLFSDPSRSLSSFGFKNENRNSLNHKLVGAKSISLQSMNWVNKTVSILNSLVNVCLSFFQIIPLFRTSSSSLSWHETSPILQFIFSGFGDFGVHLYLVENEISLNHGLGFMNTTARFMTVSINLCLLFSVSSKLMLSNDPSNQILFYKFNSFCLNRPVYSTRIMTFQLERPNTT